MLGGALALAVLSAMETGRTNHLLDRHDASAHAMTTGLQRARFVGGLFVPGATVVGLRTRDSRGEHDAAPIVVEPELATVARGGMAR